MHKIKVFRQKDSYLGRVSPVPRPLVCATLKVLYGDTDIGSSPSTPTECRLRAFPPTVHRRHSWNVPALQSLLVGGLRKVCMRLVLVLRIWSPGAHPRSPAGFPLSAVLFEPSWSSLPMPGDASERASPSTEAISSSRMPPIARTWN